MKNNLVSDLSFNIINLKLLKKLTRNNVGFRSSVGDSKLQFRRQIELVTINILFNVFIIRPSLHQMVLLLYGHIHFIEPTLILTMRINTCYIYFQPTQNSK